MGRKQEEAKMNNVSAAPNKKDLICKGQALVDRNHDRRSHLKSAQVTNNCWMVWNCNAIDHMEVPQALMLHFPRFLCVRQLYLTSTSAGKHFVQCTYEKVVRVKEFPLRVSFTYQTTQG